MMIPTYKQKKIPATYKEAKLYIYSYNSAICWLFELMAEQSSKMI